MEAFQGFPHLIGVGQFEREWLEGALFPGARAMKRAVKNRNVTRFLEGMGMVTLFWEPSTRTRISFEMAMCRLGGWVVTTENAEQFSSTIKGETLEDTIRVVSGYRPDVIVMRHNEKGSAQRASQVASVPIINAGDGTGEHPTQALLDLFTIQEEIGRLDNIAVALVGDLLNGRTVHSLARILTCFRGVRLQLVSPTELALPQDMVNILAAKGVEIFSCKDVREIANQVDVIYQTRTQTERGSRARALDEGAFCTINQEVLNLMQPHAVLLHPLPRNQELDSVVDGDVRAAYFRQAENGLYVRMGLLKLILTP